MSTYRGIPLRSAILIRHTPNDHRADGTSGNSGAIPVAMARRANDYIGRYGDYRDKGDIERQPTASDLDLREDYAGRWAEGHSLDYIARLGGYATKGAERQVDASLWNQYGPVDVAEVSRQMREAGGAFVDSLVSIERKHADQLGITSKEDMQRLIRSTWTRAVEEWGLIANPADIRWVASYHTDANMSVHAHVHTWSARGEIEVGATVPRDGTRRAKEVVYAEGYAGIRAERDRRATFLRDLSRLEIRRQLDLEVSPEKERRIAERAQWAGWPERLSPAPDLSREGGEKVSALCEKLRGELGEGFGRLSDNYRAQATARDIVKAIEEHSPTFGALARESAEHADAKAAMRGFGRVEDSKEARDFVRGEMEDRMKRLASEVVRAHVPEPDRTRPMREDLQRLDMREREGWGNVTFSEKLLHEGRDGFAEVRLPGSAERVVVPTAEMGEINRGSGRLAAVEEARAYEVRGPEGEPVRTMDGAEVISRLGEADMSRVAECNPEQASAEHERQQREAARKAADERRERERERMEQERAAALENPTKSLSDYSVKHGVSLEAAASMGRDAERLARSVERSGARSFDELSPRDRERAERIADTLVRSSAPMREVFERTAESMSRRSGIPAERCIESLRAEAVRQTRDAVVERAASGTLAPQREHEGHAGMGIADAIAGIAEAVANGAGQAQAASRRSRHHRDVDRSRELEIEQERS